MIIDNIIEIEVGDSGMDFQIANFLDAITSVIGFFIANRSICEEEIIKSLKLYAKISEMKL